MSVRRQNAVCRAAGAPTSSRSRGTTATSATWTSRAGGVVQECDASHPHL